MKHCLAVAISIMVQGLLISNLFAEQKNDSSYDSAYVIGAGDILDISVWKNDEMSKTLTVLPDGKITFPLIGTLTANGKTVSELKKEIEKKLSPYIQSPVLSVVVQRINSMYVYVIGRVNNPGRIDISTNLNVLQALSMAGGLTPFAKKNEIRIQRDEGNSRVIFEFNYDDVTKKGNLKQNIMLKRGDTIVVP